MIPIRKINIEKIKQNIDWSPTTSMYVGLQKTINWYFDNFSLNTPEDSESDN